MTNKRAAVIGTFLLGTLFSFYFCKIPFAFAQLPGETIQVQTSVQQEEEEAVQEEEQAVQTEEENEMNAAAGQDVAVQTGTVDPTVPFDGTSLADNLVDAGANLTPTVEDQINTNTTINSGLTTGTTTQSTQPVTETTTQPSATTIGDIGTSAGTAVGALLESAMQTVTQTSTQTETTQSTDVSTGTVPSSNEPISSITAGTGVGEQVIVGAGDTTVSANAGATQTVNTEDLSQQPQNTSPVETVTNVLSGGNEESTTTATGGVNVSSGETQAGTQMSGELGIGGGESTATGATQTVTETTQPISETVASGTETVGGATAQVGAEENVTVGAGETTVSANAGATQTVTTEDVAAQPKDASLIDKVIGALTGGQEESTTTATGGVNVSSGQTQVSTETGGQLGLGGGGSNTTETVSKNNQAVTETTTPTTGTTTETAPSGNQTGSTTTIGGGTHGNTSVQIKPAAPKSKVIGSKTNQGHSFIERITRKFSGNREEIKRSNLEGTSGNCEDSETENTETNGAGSHSSRCADQKSKGR